MEIKQRTEMNVLINLISCQGYACSFCEQNEPRVGGCIPPTMTVDVGGRKQKIRLAGTSEDLYFCGKDVCNALGYVDYKQALKNRIDKDEKTNLAALIEKYGSNTPNKGGPTVHPNTLGSRKPLNYRKGKAVYINEAGFYSIVMTSRAVFAKQFKRLVCSVILPSIRKYGVYVDEKQLKANVDALGLKESELERLMLLTNQKRAHPEATTMAGVMKQIGDFVGFEVVVDQ